MDSISTELTFDRLAQVEEADAIPFAQLANNRSQAESGRKLLRFISARPVERTSVIVDQANCLNVLISFDVSRSERTYDELWRPAVNEQKDQWKSNEANDFFDPDDFNDDIDLDNDLDNEFDFPFTRSFSGNSYGTFNRFERHLSVLIKEKKEDGPLEFLCFCDLNRLDISKQSLNVELDAALYLLWGALAESAGGMRKQEQVARLRKLFVRAREQRIHLQQTRQKLFTEFSDIRLSSLVLNANPSARRHPTLKLAPGVNARYRKYQSLFETTGLEEFDDRVPWRLRVAAPLDPFYFGSTLREYAELTELIQYRFSDGALISLGEILKNPHGYLVPPDLLPGEFRFVGDQWTKHFHRIQPPAAEEDFNTFSLVPDFVPSYGMGHEILSIDQVVLQLLARIGRRLQDKSVVVELSVPNETVQLEEVTVGAREILTWREKFKAEKNPEHAAFATTVDEFELVQKATEHSQELAAFGMGVLDEKRKSFWVEPLVRNFSIWEKLKFRFRFFQGESISFEADTLPYADSDLRRPPRAVFKVVGQDLIKKTRSLLKDETNFSVDGLAEAQTHVRIASQPELHIGSNGEFFLVRKLSRETGNPDLNYPYLNGFSPFSLQVFRALARGLTGFFGVEPTLMAPRSSLHRPLELRLLKHTGIVNLIIFETLSVSFRGALSDATIVNNPQELFDRLQIKILLLLGIKDAKPFVQLVSRTVYRHFVKFINEIYLAANSRSDETMPFPDGPMAFPSLIPDELRLIHALLEYTVLMHGADVFSKARINLLDTLFPFDEQRLREAGVMVSSERVGIEARPANWIYLRLPFTGRTDSSAAKTIAALNPLLKADFKMYLRGQPIEELGAADFVTELELDETQAEPAGPVALQKKQTNWFELHPKIFLRGKELSASEVAKAWSEGMVQHNGRFYLIPAARLLSLKRLNDFWLRLSEGKKGSSISSLAANIFPVPRSQVLEILALRNSGIPVTGGEKWNEICAFYDGLEKSDRALALPDTIHADLKEYQKHGVRRLYELYRLGLGSILADDMGLGKTLQTLAFLELVRTEKRMGHVLIVVPTSLTYNWLSEQEKFVPELPMQVFSSRAKEAVLDLMREKSQSVLLTTYGLLQEHAEFFQNIQWNITVFDEAQNLKNITALRTTAARGLKSEIKICLTGTPLENHLGELYSLLDLVVPGSLGGIDEFRKTYVTAPSITAEDLAYLKLRMRPLVLRRTKKQILEELPEKRESVVAFQFDGKQKKIYRDIAISYNEQIQEALAEQGEAKLQLRMLTALLRLRQACSDPGALPGVKYTGVSPKLEALVEAIKEISESGESALVFTQFLHTLEKASTLLKDAGCSTFVIHGGLSQKSRETALRSFNELEGGGVLVMTLKTGGVGLNLAKASYVFHLEPWWNPAVENQATDRAHRLGQKRAVQVYRYIMHESVEEKIEKLKLHKQKTFSAVFTEVESLAGEADTKQLRIASGGSHLSREDFNFLLS